MSLTNPLRTEELSVSTEQRHLDRYTTRPALEGQVGKAYSEEAFRYFLSLERKRSERSNRSFLLLLVDLKEQSRGLVRLEPRLLERLFDALSLGLRETDFVGWYRQGQVVGAVLTQVEEAANTEVCALVGKRICHALNTSLPVSLASDIQVRVYQLPPVTPRS